MENKCFCYISFMLFKIKIYSNSFFIQNLIFSYYINYNLVANNTFFILKNDILATYSLKNSNTLKHNKPYER